MTETLHSHLGPSGAAAWRRCPGKINAERGLADRTSRAAAEGTVFHAHAALAFEMGVDPASLGLGLVHTVDGHEITYDQEMADAMSDGLAWLEERCASGGQVFVETRVDISDWCGTGQFGTLDVAVCEIEHARLTIFDWKYGKGEVVVPVKNDQCYLYCLGAWKTFAKALFAGIPEELIEVVFCIEQPRAPGGGGVWRTTVAEVLAEGERIREDAIATMAPNAPRIPGEKQCTFCRASGQCPEQQAFLLELFGQRYDEIEALADVGAAPILPAPADLTAVARSFLLMHWKMFKKYVDQARALALDDLRHGRDVPYLKAVEGRAGRRYFLPDATEAVLATLDRFGPRDEFLTLQSPAAIEKAITKAEFKKFLAPFTGQPPGKVALVRREDKRPEIKSLAEMYPDFDGDDDDEDDD